MNILLSSVLALFVTSVTGFTAMAQELKGDAKAGAGKIATFTRALENMKVLAEGGTLPPPPAKPAAATAPRQ